MPEKTYNTLVQKMATRAGELSRMPMDQLRACYPETTETEEELIRHLKQIRLPKERLVADILYEEFSEEFDFSIETG